MEPPDQARVFVLHAERPPASVPWTGPSGCRLDLVLHAEQAHLILYPLVGLLAWAPASVPQEERSGQGQAFVLHAELSEQAPRALLLRVGLPEQDPASVLETEPSGKNRVSVLLAG